MRSRPSVMLLPLLLGFVAPTTRSCWSSRPSLLPIASVSVQKILTEADAGKAATEELEKARRVKTDDFNKKKAALDATRKQIADPAVNAVDRQQLVNRALRQEAELQEENQRF